MPERGSALSVTDTMPMSFCFERMNIDIVIVIIITTYRAHGTGKDSVP